MNIRIVRFSTDAVLDFAELSLKMQKKCVLLMRQLEHNELTPGARLHKLSGTEYWSVSIDMSHRILFLYEGNVLLILRIGDHSVYDE